MTSKFLEVATFVEGNPVVREAVQEPDNHVVEVGNIRRWCAWMVGQYYYCAYWKKYYFIEGLDEQTQVVCLKETVPNNWWHDNPATWHNWYPVKCVWTRPPEQGDVIMSRLPRRIQMLRVERSQSYT